MSERYVSSGIKESRPYTGRDYQGVKDDFSPEYVDWLNGTQAVIDQVVAGLNLIPSDHNKVDWKQRIREIVKPIVWYNKKEEKDSNSLDKTPQPTYFSQGLAILTEKNNLSDLPFKNDLSFYQYFFIHIALPTLMYGFRNFNPDQNALLFVQEQELKQYEKVFKYENRIPKTDLLLGVTEMRIIFDRYKILARNTTIDQMNDFAKKHLKILVSKYRLSISDLEISFAFVVAGLITDVSRDLANEVKEFDEKTQAEQIEMMKDKSIVALRAISELWKQRKTIFNQNF